MSLFQLTIKKANAFNDFFSSVYVPTALDSSINLQEVTFGVLEIENILSKCDDSSSMVSYQVPSFLLRDGCQILTPAVMALFQVIQKSSNWPKEWKTSYITPLHKKGSTSDVKKIVRSACFQSFLLFLKKCSIFLYPLVRPLTTNPQHGFMKRRSTNTQLISYFDVLYNNLDKNFPCTSVCFDIRKAFGSFPHHRLLTKLATFGFDEVFLHFFFGISRRSTPNCPYRVLFFRPSVVASEVPKGSVFHKVFHFCLSCT